jgi:hypothetical protein
MFTLSKVTEIIVWQMIFEKNLRFNRTTLARTFQ